LFDPRYFFVPEELLPPKKRIYSSSSSLTTLSNSSWNQTCDLVSPSSSVYTPTPPQIFEIGKCPIKMYLKHHEGQIEDILNYLDELYLHHIEKMEEGRIDRMIIRRNSNELKTKLKKIRTQIIKLQKKRLGQKDKIAFAHYKISDLERIIEKIQARVCTVKCRICNKVGHLTRNCRRKGPATRNDPLSMSVTCHACGEKGHYKSQFSKTDNNTFHVSKKNLCDESLVIPKKEIWLNYMEESVEIMDQEVNKLRRRCIPIVKVRWNSEFTWEREDQIRAKYPHLFSNIIVSLN
ncbi:putative reverse transcriptase domain-containing protein, partial [Tanacetum coccineum]